MARKSTRTNDSREVLPATEGERNVQPEKREPNAAMGIPGGVLPMAVATKDAATGGIASQASGLWHRIQSAEVNSPATYELLATWVRGVKTIASRLTAHHQRSIAAAFKAHQEAIKTRNTALESLHLSEAESLGKSKLAAWVLNHPETHRLEGISFADDWRAEIVDASKLPREYLQPDLSKIAAVVTAMKKETNIPGVNVICRKKVIVRT